VRAHGFLVGDKEGAAQVLDVKGPERTPGGQVRVLEGAGQGHGLEVLVKDINPALPDVGRVQEVARAIVTDGQARVDGAGDQGRHEGLAGTGGGDVGVPAGDDAVEAGGEESGRAALAPGADDEVRRAVENLAGGRPLGRAEKVQGIGGAEPTAALGDEGG